MTSLDSVGLVQGQLSASLGVQIIPSLMNALSLPDNANELDAVAYLLSDGYGV